MLNEKKRTNNLLLHSVACKLKRLRQDKNLTQETVTHHTGINIGLIELGKTNISLITLAALCSYYNVPLEEFFNEIEYEKETFLQ